MVYEIRIKSRGALYRELRGLEVDAGIRADAKLEGKAALVFITRHSGKYAIWIRAKRHPKGDKGTFVDFERFSELRDFLHGALVDPLKAYVY